MRRKADAIVIGAGLVGTSIALELSRKGQKTVVIDRHADAGLGFTAHASAILCSFHGTRPGLTLAIETRKVFERWREHVADDRPRARFERVGAALLDALDGPRVDALQRLLGAFDVHVESLCGRESGSLIPELRAPRTRVLYESAAGVVNSATLAARDVRRAAEALQAEFRLGERVVGITRRETRGACRATGVMLADGTKLEAPVVVNAGGAHSAELNLLADAPLPITTAPLAHLLVTGKLASNDTLPAIIDLQSGTYLRVQRGSFQLGATTSRDNQKYLSDPDKLPEIPRSVQTHRSRLFHRHFPGVRWRQAETVTAPLDVVVADWHPILDRTQLGGYYAATGAGGSWSTCGPAIGWLMTELIQAVEGGRDHDGDPLKVRLPHSRLSFDLGTFSRNRRPIQSDLGRHLLA